MNVSRIRFWSAVACLLTLVVCLKLVYLERWLQDNDGFITLSTFFSSAGHDDYVDVARRLRAALVSRCSADDTACVGAAGSVFMDLTYTRPITAFFGAQTAAPAALASSEAFLDAVRRATVLHVATGAALVGVLLMAILVTLPRQVGGFLAATLSLFGAIGFLLPEVAPFDDFQPLLGVGWGGGFVVLVLASFAYWVSRSGRSGRDQSPPGQTELYCWAGALALLTARVLLFRTPELYFSLPVPGSGVGLLIVLLGGVATSVAVVSARQAAHEAGANPARLWVALLLLAGFVSVGENFYATAFHIASRGYVILLAAPVLVYAALRPSGYALWLLPLAAIFHISIAVLLYACLIATEGVVLLRRRTPSLALVLAVGLFAVTVFFTGATGENRVIPAEAASLAPVVARIDLAEFLPGAIVLAILAAAAAVAWRLPAPSGDLLLRAVALAAALAGAGQLRQVLQAAGVNIMDPAAYNFILMSYYLAPMVCAAGIALTILGLAARTSDPTAGTAFVGRALSLATAAVVALAAARAATAVGRPVDPLEAMATAVGIVKGGDSERFFTPEIIAAASPDDQYVAGPYGGSVVTTVTILKMKARSATGLLDPARATIVNTPP